MLISLSIKWSVDDPRACQGVVLSRAVIILRSIETQPLTGRFVHYVEQSSIGHLVLYIQCMCIHVVWYAKAYHAMVYLYIHYCMVCFFFLSQTFAYIYKQKTWIDICMSIRKIYVLCIMCNVLYLWFYQVYAMYTWYFCKYNFCIYLWHDPVDICKRMSKNITSPVSMDICKDERFAYIYSEFDGYMQLLTIIARLRCPSAWLYGYRPMHCDRSYPPHDLLCIYLYVQLVVQQF